ncbi:UNVERIFIED_ORG: hypothetical protein ABIB52_000210 [Arthrobacter sp. UYCu721]
MKTSNITRGLALSAFAAAALVAPAQPAVAAATPEPIVASFSTDCPGFEVLFSGTGKVGVIPLPGDRLTLIWPKLGVTITGPTGKSVSYVATGVNHIQNLPDGSQYITATGPNVITVPEDNGHPAGVYYTTGTVSWTLNPDGSEQGDMFSGNGRVTDVCQLVAP